MRAGVGVGGGGEDESFRAIDHGDDDIDVGALERFADVIEMRDAFDHGEGAVAHHQGFEPCQEHRRRGGERESDHAVARRQAASGEANETAPLRAASRRKPRTTDDGMATPSPPTIIALMPTTRPAVSTSGPPEFPGASRTSAAM